MMLSGTAGDLYEVRAALKNLRAAAASLHAIHDPDAPVVQAKADALASATFYVPVKCMFCPHVGAAGVPVDDPRNGVPRACICKPCDDRTTAEATREMQSQ